MESNQQMQNLETEASIPDQDQIQEQQARIQQTQNQSMVQQASKSVIDFKTELRKEKALSEQKLVLKNMTEMNVFNLLQDIRHLIILDFRTEEQFAASHIRKAVRCELSNYKEKVAESLVTLHENQRPGASPSVQNEVNQAVDSLKVKQKIDGTKFKSQYPGDDLKRVLFVFPDGDQKTIEKQISQEIPILSEQILTVSKERLSKAFFLKDYVSFQKKYPLVCVPDQCSNEKQAVQSMSRYPSELKKDQLFLGNLTNVMSQDFYQLKMLGIKTVIHFTPQKFDSLEKDFECIHYEIKKVDKDLEILDLQPIVDQIKEVMDQKEKQPVFIFCVNGMFSGAIGVKLIMEYNKTFNRELAMAYVSGKRYEVKDMPGWLYQMIKMPDAQSLKNVNKSNAMNQLMQALD